MTDESKPSVRPLEEVLRAIKACIDQGMGRDQIAALLGKKFLSQKTGEPYTESAISGMVNRNREKYGLYFINVSHARRPGDEQRVYKKKGKEEPEATSVEPQRKKERIAKAPKQAFHGKKLKRKNKTQPDHLKGKETSMSKPSEDPALTVLEIIDRVPKKRRAGPDADPFEKGLREYQDILEGLIKGSPHSIEEIMKQELRLQELWQLFPESVRPSREMPQLCQCAIKREGHELSFCGQPGTIGMRGLKRCIKHRGMTSAN